MIFYKIVIIEKRASATRDVTWIVLRRPAVRIAFVGWQRFAQHTWRTMLKVMLVRSAHCHCTGLQRHIQPDHDKESKNALRPWGLSLSNSGQ